jgi:hypothetical protein
VVWPRLHPDADRDAIVTAGVVEDGNVVMLSKLAGNAALISTDDDRFTGENEVPKDSVPNGWRANGCQGTLARLPASPRSYVMSRASPPPMARMRTAGVQEVTSTNSAASFRHVV